MQLKKTLGPVQLAFYSVGVIIGAGVYSVIGPAAGVAQQGLWLSFVMGAVVALLTALSYAEMATAFPAAGAEYVYLRHALPDAGWAAFCIGALILLGGAAAATTVAVAFGGYLKVFLDVPVTLSALALLVVCTGFNLWGLQESSWANILFTIVEVAGLVLIIAAGIAHDNIGERLMVPSLAGVVPAAAILFFVYLGFEEVANLAEEVRYPARDLPRAMFLSIGITTVLYVLVSLSVIGLATPDELAASEAPLAMAIQKVWPGAGNVLAGIALFATANTVLITLIAASRLAFSMSRDGELPMVFAKVTVNRQTPLLAIVLAFVTSAVLLPIGNLKILAELASFSALLAFLGVNVALIILRYRMPEHPRPFLVPLTIGRMPILPLAAIASIGVLLINFDRSIYFTAIGALALIGLAYWIRRQWRRATML